jgi:hypothetical protein
MPFALPPPYGDAFCWVTISVDMIGNEPANTETNEAVFLGGLSSEQPLCRNPCALLVYILILSWQDISTDTKDSKLHSLQPLFWCGSHSAASGSRKSCLYAFRLGVIA